MITITYPSGGFGIPKTITVTTAEEIPRTIFAGKKMKYEEVIRRIKASAGGIIHAGDITVKWSKDSDIVPPRTFTDSDDSELPFN